MSASNAMAPVAAPDGASDATQSVIATLEEEIVLGMLHPRERLTEDELIARFGLKRHVVREVLGALDRMGLIERRKNIGALVRSFTAREVVELYQTRELLETGAAALLPLPLSEVQLAPLVAIQQQHDQAVRAGDVRQVFRHNQAFHRELFGLTGNQVLRDAIDEYARRTHSIRFVSLTVDAYRESARSEHWAMIEAIRQGDRERLVSLCRRHLLPSRDAYLAVERQRDPARLALAR